MNRFKPPESDTEPLVICDNCGSEQHMASLFYDEYFNIYLCDRECFDLWHDNNFDKVGDYYWEHRIM